MSPGQTVSATDAVERLQLSRQRLRLAMRPAADTSSSTFSPVGGKPRAWLSALRANPAGRLVIDAVETWWAQHPLRLAGVLLSESASGLVQPVARRHPWALVLGGLVLGAVVVKVRPWRWLVKPAMLAGLATSMASGVMAHLPAQSWLAIIAALTPPSRPAPAAPARATQAESTKAFTGL